MELINPYRDRTLTAPKAPNPVRTAPELVQPDRAASAQLVNPYRAASSGTGLVNPYRTGSAASSAPAAPDTDRSIGEVIKDTAVSGAIGVGNLAKAGTDIYSAVSGDYDTAPGRRVASNLEALQGMKSPGLQQQEAIQRERVGLADGMLGKAGAAFGGTLSNPALLGSFVAEQAPILLGPMAAGRAAGITARALGMSSRNAGRAATGGAIGAGAAMQGGSVATETYQRVAQQPPEAFDALPAYQERIAAGETPQAAREAVALAMARQAGLESATTSVGVNALPGARVLDRALAGQATRTGGGVIKGVATGALAEGVTEAIEEGQGQFAANRQVKMLDPNQRLDEGVGEAAGLGALGGGLFGGVAGGMRGRAQEAPPDAPPGTPPTLALPNLPNYVDSQGRPVSRPGEVPPGGGIRESVRAEGVGRAETGPVEPLPSTQAPPESTTDNSIDLPPRQEQDEQGRPTEPLDVAPSAPGDIGVSSPEKSRSSRAELLGRRAQRYAALAETEPDPDIRRDLERQAQIARTKAEGEIERANSTQVQPDDVTGSKAPFRTESAAKAQQKKRGLADTYFVAQVEEGFVLRPIESSENTDVESDSSETVDELDEASRSSRDDEQSRIPDLGRDDSSLPVPEDEGLPPVRREGDQGLPGVAGELPGVLPGDGAATDRNVDREDRQRQGLRAEQLPLGERDRAGTQYDAQSQVQPRRADTDDRRVEREDEATGAGAQSETAEPRLERETRADDTDRRASTDSGDADVRRDDATDSTVVAEDRNQPARAEEATRRRVERREGADNAGDQTLDADSRRQDAADPRVGEARGDQLPDAEEPGAELRLEPREGAQNTGEDGVVDGQVDGRDAAADPRASDGAAVGREDGAVDAATERSDGEQQRRVDSSEVVERAGPDSASADSNDATADVAPALDDDSPEAMARDAARYREQQAAQQQAEAADQQAAPAEQPSAAPDLNTAEGLIRAAVEQSGGNRERADAYLEAQRRIASKFGRRPIETDEAALDAALSEAGARSEAATDQQRADPVVADETVPDQAQADSAATDTAAPASAPQSAPQSAPERIVKKNGEPFTSEATAKRAASARKIDDAQVVPVEGGFAIERGTTAQDGGTQAIATGTSSQSGTTTLERVTGKGATQRMTIEPGKNGTVITRVDGGPPITMASREAAIANATKKGFMALVDAQGTTSSAALPNQTSGESVRIEPIAGEKSRVSMSVPNGKTLTFGTAAEAESFAGARDWNIETPASAPAPASNNADYEPGNPASDPRFRVRTDAPDGARPQLATGPAPTPTGRPSYYLASGQTGGYYTLRRITNEPGSVGRGQKTSDRHVKTLGQDRARALDKALETIGSGQTLYNADYDGAAGARSVSSTTLRFGKYQGSSLEQVAEQDPNYLAWLASESGRAQRQKQPKKFQAALADVLEANESIRTAVAERAKSDKARSDKQQQQKAKSETQRELNSELTRIMDLVADEGESRFAVNMAGKLGRGENPGDFTVKQREAIARTMAGKLSGTQRKSARVWKQAYERSMSMIDDAAAGKAPAKRKTSDPFDDLDEALPDKSESSTAPEHAGNVGKPLNRDEKYTPVATSDVTVDAPISPISGSEQLPIEVSDFRQVTDEFARVFAQPGERVNLEAVTRERAEVLTPEQAADRIEQWKDEAAAQASVSSPSDNMQRTVLSLFDLTGTWSQPYVDAGYEVLRFDIQSDKEFGDIMKFGSEFFNENFNMQDVYAILAACPCTDFASSGARWFDGKDKDGRTEASKELVFQTMRTIEYFRPNVWALENPVGRIKSLTGLPDPRLTFQPHHFGLPYTKKSQLYGQFDANLPSANVEPTEGSKMWTSYGGKSLATKNARSATPEGFAYGFWKANNYLGSSVERQLVETYPEASGGVAAALKAGVPREAIDEAMQDTYENYEYQDARDALVKLALEAKAAPGPVARPARSDTATKPTKPQRGSTAPISDFGNKIGGARKDLADAYANALSVDLDVASVPLSKSFPKPNYEKLAAEGADPQALAFVALARVLIPAKPRRAYLFNRWAETVTTLRDASRDAISGQRSVDELRQLPALSKDAQLRDISEMVDVVAQVPPKFLARLPKLRMISGMRRNPDTGKVDKPFYALATGSDRDAFDGMMGEADTLAEAKRLGARALIERLESPAKKKPSGPKRRTAFKVYRSPGTKASDSAWFVGLKTPGGMFRAREGLSLEQARRVVREEPDALEAELAEKRKAPTLRRKGNEERTGAPRREGDITPEAFQQTFGFYGVEFGNYVEGPRRQTDLNNAYDALSDLAATIGVEPRALSLNGTLGLAFGARGRGGSAAAHYEAGSIAINLTKASGPGSLAHEWLHGLDNYLARQDRSVEGRKPSGEFITNAVSKRGAAPAAMRTETFEAVRDVVKQIRESEFAKRSSKIDAGRSKPYFGTTIEMAARAFEKYIVDSLALQGVANDYLANIDTSGGAYPSDAEMEAGIGKSFENLFDVIDTKETDSGVAMFSRNAPAQGQGAPISRADIDTAIADITKRWKAGPKVNVVDTGEALPAAIQRAARAQGAPISEVQAVFFGGEVFVVADKMSSQREVQRAIFHEVYGHYGVAKLFGRRANSIMAAMYNEVGGDAGMAKLAEKYNVDLSDYAQGTKGWSQRQRESLLMSEMLAHIAEKETGTLRQRARNLLALVRDWLRQNGFAALLEGSRANDAVSSLLREAASAIHRPATERAANDAQFMVAYHGTPHQFDKFSTDSMGTGEGAQAYGWGLYFASAKEVAESYRENLTARTGMASLKVYDALEAEMSPQEARSILQTAGDVMYDDLPIDKAGRRVTNRSVSLRQRISDEQATAYVQQAIDILTERRGTTYQVDLKPEENEYLQYFGTLDKQPEVVRKALLEGPVDVGLKDGDTMTGGYAYGKFEVAMAHNPSLVTAMQETAGTTTTRPDQLTSEYLRALGVRGVKYKDQLSRNSAGEATHNYVIFDDADVSIEAQFLRRTAAERAAQIRSTAQAAANKSAPVIKRWVTRNFTKEGLRNRETFERGVLNDAEREAGEIEVEAINFDLQKAMAKAAGVRRYSQVSDEDKARVSDYLSATDANKAKIGEDIEPEVRQVADAMRAFLDRHSVEVARSLKELNELERAQLDEKATDALERYESTNGEEGSVPPRIARRSATIEKIESNIGRYVNRSYRAFDDPAWKDKVLENADLMQRAEAFIADQNPSFTPGEVTGAVRGILQRAQEDGNFVSFLSKGSKQGNKDVSILKKRKDMPPILLELLGEYRDPRVNFARSATKMQYLVANHAFLMGVRQDGLGTWLFERETNEFDTQLAAKDSDTFDPLAGLYSTADYKQGLIDAQNSFEGSDLMRNIIRINSAIKYGKVVLSPATQARNLQSALMFLVMNGHFNFRFLSKGFSVGKADLFTKDKEWRAYLADLTRQGVLHDSPHAGELRDAIKDFTDADRYAEGARSKVRSGLDFMTRMYQLGDDVIKIAGYENELELALEAGMSREDARAQAAYRIRNGYPTYSMVPRAIKKLRRWPLIGAFTSFAYESVRTSYNQVGFIKEDLARGHNKAAVRRIIGMSSATAAAAALAKLSMLAMGMSDEDDEAVRALLPPWSKNSRLVYFGYTDEGLPKYYDLSYMDPVDYWKRPLRALLNGNNVGIDKKMLDSGKEALAPFFGPDIAAGALFEILSNKKIGGGEVFNEADSPGRQAMAIWRHARLAIQPGFAANLERTALAATGEVSRSGKQYTLSDEGMAWLGHRVSTLNVPQSMIYKSYEFNDRIRDAASIVSRIAGSQQSMSDRQIKAAVDSMLRARAKAYTEMTRLMQAAQSLGLSGTQTLQAMRVARISAANRAAIRRGEVPRYNVSRRFTVSAEERAVLSNASPQRRREIRAEMARRRRLVRRLIRQASP